MENNNEVCAPRPVYSSSRQFRSNRSPSYLHIDIPSFQESKSEMSSPSSLASNPSSNQDSNFSFSLYENGKDQDQFGEELMRALSNDLAWDNLKRSSFNTPQFIIRPKNSFYQNLEKECKE